MSITITNPNNLPAMMRLIFANFDISPNKRAKFESNDKFNYQEFFEKYFCNPDINLKDSTENTLQKIYETFKDYAKYQIGKSSLYSLFLDLNAESNIKKIQQDAMFANKWQQLGNFFNDAVMDYTNSMAAIDEKAALDKMCKALLNNNIQLGNNKIGAFTNISMWQLCQAFMDLYINSPEIINKMQGSEKYNDIKEKWCNCLKLEQIYDDIISAIISKLDKSNDIKPVANGGRTYFLSVEKGMHSLLKAGAVKNADDYIQEIISIPVKWGSNGEETTLENLYINKLSKTQQLQVITFFAETYMNIPTLVSFTQNIVELVNIMDDDDQNIAASV